MESYIYWFVLALVLVGLELATGTFYLLVLSVAMAVGGVTAILGGNMVWQLLLGSVTGIGGTVILRRWKSSLAVETPNASLDIGQPVKVIKWTGNGMARVSYRGAEWDAETETVDTPRDDTHYIAAVRGSVLILTNRKLQQ